MFWHLLEMHIEKILLTVFRNIIAASHGKIFESGLCGIGYPDVVESTKFENYNILCMYMIVCGY